MENPWWFWNIGRSRPIPFHLSSEVICLSFVAQAKIDSMFVISDLHGNAGLHSFDLERFVIYSRWRPLYVSLSMFSSFFGKCSWWNSIKKLLLWSLPLSGDLLVIDCWFQHDWKFLLQNGKADLALSFSWHRHKAFGNPKTLRTEALRSHAEEVRQSGTGIPWGPQKLGPGFFAAKKCLWQLRDVY